MKPEITDLRYSVSQGEVWDQKGPLVPPNIQVS